MGGLDGVDSFSFSFPLAFATSGYGSGHFLPPRPFDWPQRVASPAVEEELKGLELMTLLGKNFFFCLCFLLSFPQPSFRRKRTKYDTDLLLL